MIHHALASVSSPIPRKLCFVGMSLLAAGSVFASIGHSLWDTIRLTIVAIGFVWLFRRLEPVSSIQRTLFLLGVLPLVFVYLRAGFVAELPPWAMVICGPIATALLIGALLKPAQSFCLDLLRNNALTVGISFCAVAVFFIVVRSHDYFVDASFLVGILELIFLFSAILLFTRSVEQQDLRVACWLGISSLVASSVVAWCMVGIAYHRSFKGESYFDAGQYEEATREIFALGNNFEYLEYEPLSPTGWIREVREGIEDTGTLRQWLTLAQLSMTFGDLNQEAEAYQSAHLLDPANDYLRAQYARCLFDLGHRTQALSEIEGILTEDPDSEYGYVFQALAYTRVGDLEKARKALVRACETGLSICQIGAPENGQDQVIRYSMSDISPFESKSEIGLTTLYHVVRLLESIGISVLYPPMHIGATNIFSPVDLDLLSTVDYSRQEFLRVSGSKRF